MAAAVRCWRKKLQEQSRATIITNSAFIASYIRGVEGARVVLLGGDYQNDAQVLVGPILRICAAQFRVDKLFVGADGYVPKIGFTANDHLRVQAVRDMAETGQTGDCRDRERQILKRQSSTPLQSIRALPQW